MTYDHLDEHDLRASDAERSATVDILRRHHAEGRLDTTELEERIERCYAAKTRGELDALTADLPGSRRRRRESRRPRGLVFPFPKALTSDPAWRIQTSRVSCGSRLRR